MVGVDKVGPDGLASQELGSSVRTVVICGGCPGSGVRLGGGESLNGNRARAPVILGVGAFIGVMTVGLQMAGWWE